MSWSNYTFQNGDSYPLLPTSYSFATWSLDHRHKIIKSESRSQRIETRAVGGARIEGRFGFEPMTYSDASELIAFLRYVEGGATIFALRIPPMSPTGSYTSNTSVEGEYYNLSRTAGTGDNQLVQFLSTGPVLSPVVRDGGSAIRASQLSYPPTLKCSLKGPTQQVKYPDDQIIRLSIDVVERWE